jgi:hypothetical protein
VLVLAAGAALALVAHFGRNVPYYEDWLMVPVLTGSRPWSLAWVLEPTVAEHRFVLAKTLLYPLWHIGNGDLRAAMVFDVALLAALAWSCMAVARRVRGRTVFADAFFPLALLSLGHCENLVFFSQVFFVAPVAILTAMLLVIAAQAWRGRTAVTIGLAAGLALMPASGGIGLVEAPFLGTWAAYAAWRRWHARDASGRREALILGGAVVLAIAGSALYFVGWTRLNPPASHTPTLVEIVLTATEAWSLALGGGAAQSGWFAIGPAFAMAAAVAIGALIIVATRNPHERLRSAGIAACLVATAMLALAIGVGRAALGSGAGLAPRYALLMTPALICVYFTAVLYGGPFASKWAPVALFAAACALIWPNATLGIEYGRMRAALADGVQREINLGMPPAAIAQRYAARILPGGTLLEERLTMLQSARMGPYAQAPAARVGDVVSRERRIPVNIVHAHDAVVEGDVVRGTGPDPYVVLALPAPGYVVAVRMRYSLQSDHPGPAQLQAYWMLAGRTQFQESERNAILAVTANASTQVATFWVHDTIDHVRVDPDVGGSTLRILELTLLERQ